MPREKLLDVYTARDTDRAPRLDPVWESDLDSHVANADFAAVLTADDGEPVARVVKGDESSKWFADATSAARDVE
jgi:hypothetical protein